jgi:putative transposase
MSRKYKIRDQNKLYFVTFTVVRWLDVFTRQVYRDIFLESVRYCQQHKGLEVCAYVIMSNHIHMIIGRHGDASLEAIIRDLKKYTSFKIIQAIHENPSESRKDLFTWLFEREGIRNINNTNTQFWQQNNKPIEIPTDEKAEYFLTYIHENPVKAGIVTIPEHYLYSSASNYTQQGQTLIDVILI